MSSNSSVNKTEALPQIQALVIVQVTCYVAISVIGTTGNLLLCTGLLRKTHRKTSEYFVLNLAFTDLMTCAVSIPLDIVEILIKRWPFGAFMCKIIYPLQTVLIAVSVGTLTCMALERHRAIITPFKAKISGTFIKIVVFVLWSLSVVLFSPYIAILHQNGPYCIESWSEENHPKVFTMCAFLFVYAMPLSVIAPAYIRIGFRLYSDSKALRTFNEKQGSSFNLERLSRMRSRTNERIVKTFSLGAIAFALCMLPYQVMWLWHDFGSGSEWVHFTDVLVFANAMVYFNSLIDPFIFGGFSTRHGWRRGLTESFLKCFHIRVKDSHSKLTRNNAILAFHVDKNCNNTSEEPENDIFPCFISSV